MENRILKFIEILLNNDYIARIKDIPEDFDNRDELLSEISDMEVLPDYLRYFEVNGYNDSQELKKYLEDNFLQFKIELLAGNYVNNKLLIKEIKNQIDLANQNIQQAIYETNQIKDAGLTELINLKFYYYTEALSFLENFQNSKTTSGNDIVGKNQDNKYKTSHSYRWLKEKDLLIEFYKRMVASNLIGNTTQDDFVNVFSEKPLTELNKPIQWEKGAKLLAYFINELTNRRYIPNNPKWTIVMHCFTYFSLDSYIAAKESIKAHITEISKYGAPKDANLVDDLFC